MKKTLKPILGIIALLLVIIEIFQLLVILIPAFGDLSFPRVIENYTYLALYIVLALDAFAYKGSRNTGFGLIFLVLALLLVVGIIEIPYEGGLLVALIYYIFNKNRLYFGIFVAMLGIALTSYVSNILGQIVIIIGLFIYLIKVNPNFKFLIRVKN